MGVEAAISDRDFSDWEVTFAVWLFLFAFMESIPQIMESIPFRATILLNKL